MPAYDPTAYRRKRMQLELLAAKAERACPANPARELADLLDVECLDGYNVGNARDLARWAGAAKVGRTRREAIEALAGAWVRYRALRRSAATSGRDAARVRALELGQRAHAAGRSARDQQAAERRERELVALTMAARAPGFRAEFRPRARVVLAQYAAKHARRLVFASAE